MIPAKKENTENETSDDESLKTTPKKKGNEYFCCLQANNSCVKTMFVLVFNLASKFHHKLISDSLNQETQNLLQSMIITCLSKSTKFIV